MKQTTEAATVVASRRVIVTADVHSHLPGTIELAVALAVARQSPLHGLFVEDVDLLSVAGLPFTQEVPLFGGRPRALDDRQLQRTLDKIAGQFREALGQHAQRFALNCSYSTARGRKHSMNFGEPVEAEFLIVSQPLARRRQASVKRIVFLHDHSALLLQALQVILAEDPAANYELISVGGSAEDSAQLQALLPQYPHVSLLELGADQLSRLLSAGARADYIIASRQLEPGQLQQIMRLATCPVIVVA